MPALINPTAPSETASIAPLVALAFRVANRAAVDSVRKHADSATHTSADGSLITWYDVAPMLSVERHGGATVCDHGEAIAYLIDSGLARRHPDHPMRICLPLA